MIGVEIKGSDLGGLLRYLYGPGRANDHDNPHMVAAWTGQPERIEPGHTKGGSLDLRALAEKLEAPNRLMKTPQRQHVLHVPLSAAKVGRDQQGNELPADRILSDQEWGEIARRVVKDLGLGDVNDPGGVRWIAVRHSDQHVHLVATLARQNGGRADVSYSRLKISDSCARIEADFNLRPAGPADSTAERKPARGEMEKFKRIQAKQLREAGGRAGIPGDQVAGHIEQRNKALDSPVHPDHPRLQLARTVQRVAAQSCTTEDFVDRMQRQATSSVGSRNELVFKPSPRADGEGWRGYSIGFKHWSAMSNDGLVRPVMYGGGTLDPQLSLPRLERERGWNQALPSPAPGSPAIQPAQASKTPPGPSEERVASRLPHTSLTLNLRHLAGQAAAEAHDVDSYFAALRRRGVVVVPRMSKLPGEEDKVTGYKLGLKAQRNSAGKDLEWVVGSKVDSNGAFTLRQLQRRWDGVTPDPIAAPLSQQAGPSKPRAGGVAVDAVSANREAIQASVAAAEITRRRAGAGKFAATDDVARSAADLLHSASAAWERAEGGPFTEAARSYDRAHRIPNNRSVNRSDAGADLTLAALGLGLAASARSPEAIERIALMSSMKMLLEVIAEIRIAQLRPQAASAARAAAGYFDAGIRRHLGAMSPAQRAVMLQQASALGSRIPQSVTPLPRPSQELGPGRGR